MRKLIIMLMILSVMGFSQTAEASIWKPKTGQQVAKKNARNSVKSGKKTMKKLRKASRTIYGKS